MIRPTTTLITGTGAALEVELGFSPNALILGNVTEPVMGYWTSDMEDDSLMLIKSGSSAFTFVTSDGITPTDPDDDFRGFTLGADSTMNGDDDIIYVTAW